MSRGIRSILLGATVLSGVAAAFSASAADAPPSNVDEVIVTATRHAQSLQDTPLAVTAVSDVALQERAITDVRQLERLAPTLKYIGSTTTKIGSFAIRNVGNFTLGDAYDSSVGVAVDGVSNARPGVRIGDFVDIERVEVSEGPQGMLFGKNATAGLVNIITRQPQMGEFGGRTRVSYGNFNELQTDATLNIPFGDRFAVRATAWRFVHDGYVTVADDVPQAQDKLGEKNSWGGRFRFRAQPNDKLDINLTAEFTGSDDDPSALTIREFFNDRLGVRAYEESKGVFASSKSLKSTQADQYSRLHSQTYLLNVDYDVGSLGTLTGVVQSQNSNNHLRVRGSTTSAPNFNTYQADDGQYDQANYELRLTSGGDQRLRYVVGVNYSDQKIAVQQENFANQIGTPLLAIYAVSRYATFNRAVFGEVTYDLTEDLRLILGGRLSNDKIRADTDRSYLVPQPVIPGVNDYGTSRGPIYVSQSIKASEPSWRIGAQYDFSDDIMVYTTASHGYKAPGLDVGRNTQLRVFNVTQGKVFAETATNYEVGIRSQFLDRRITLNATAFWEVFKDFQTTVRLPANFVLTAAVNAGEIQVKGIEATLDARVTDDFRLSLFSAYIDSEYTDFDNAPCYPNQPTAPVGTPLVRGICVGAQQTLNGYPLPSAPKWRLRADARYEPQIGSNLRGLIGGAVRYQSSEVFSSSGNPRDGQDGYAIVDLQAGISPLDGPWQLRAYVNNLFEKNFIARTIDQGDSYEVQVTTYAAQRTYGIALTVEF